MHLLCSTCISAQFKNTTNRKCNLNWKLFSFQLSLLTYQTLWLCIMEGSFNRMLHSCNQQLLWIDLTCGCLPEVCSPSCDCWDLTQQIGRRMKCRCVLVTRTLTLTLSGQCAGNNWSCSFSKKHRMKFMLRLETRSQVSLEAKPQPCDLRPKTVLVWVYRSSQSHSDDCASILTAWVWLLTIN